MKRIASVSLVAVLAAIAASASRPALGVWYNPGVRVGYGVGLGYGMGAYGGWGYGGYGWGGGGTAAGNYLQGMSQVIRAQGEYEESRARARISQEEARTKYIDNKKKWTETYFAMREQNQARQAEKRERNRISPETVKLAARSAVPKPLSTYELDPITGRINWPEALQGGEFAKQREDIERLLELRASTSGGGDNAQLQDVVQQMTATLKSNIQKLPVNDYIAARKFLDSLSYWARS